MARIRTIKPEFFRHEALQDLASVHGAEIMLVFAGLWGHCDKAGRFEWKPRTLKLDILPFLAFDMATMLDILSEAGFVRRYSVCGKDYGLIETFQEHQRIGGKEAQEPPKHPEPDCEATAKQQGSNGEVMGIAGREGKGTGREQEEEQEEEEEGKRKGTGREQEPLRESVVEDPEKEAELKPAGALQKKFFESPYREEAERFADWYATTQKPESIRGTPKELEQWSLVWYHLRETDRRDNVAEIAEAIAWARGDPFWCRNFLSPAKLRQRDKNGQMFIDRFISEYQQHKQRGKNGTGIRGITPDKLQGIFDWIDNNPELSA